MAFHLPEPLVDNVAHTLDKDRPDAPQVTRHMRLSLMQLAFDGLNELIYISWLYNVIIHLLTDRLHRSLESRIAGDDDGHCIGLDTPHRTDNCEAVSRLTDVEIGEQHVELFFLN